LLNDNNRFLCKMRYWNFIWENDWNYRIDQVKDENIYPHNNTGYDLNDTW
jgi:hypothetical protein